MTRRARKDDLKPKAKPDPITEATTPAGPLVSRRGLRVASGPAPNRDSVGIQPDRSAQNLQSTDEATALLIAEGVAANLSVLRAASARSLQTPEGAVDATALMIAMSREADAVRDGDLGTMEGMLASQASALNAVFATYAVKAMAAENHVALDSYMRLAFRAQAQSRAAIEALGVLKNPPTLFAKQANIATNQQINNGDSGPVPVVGITNVTPRARTAQDEFTPNKLLEAGAPDARMDTGTKAATATCDSALEAVDTLNRTEKPRRKSACGSKRLQGRNKTAASSRITHAKRTTRSTQ